jgi:hypothetical protein
MKQAILIIYLLIVLTGPLYSQKSAAPSKSVTHEYTAIDKKALLLPDSLTRTTDNIAKYLAQNFKTDKEKMRAIFVWLGSNIQYDIENMFAINFYESKEDKIVKPLRTRKGICENYASLFTEIAVKTGVPSFVVEGYTVQDDFADYLPHAWCAALIDTTWFMFDPTWGSGYIDDGEFVRKINNDYFMVSPSVFIKTHMPFDFLWQFLHYPITALEFYESKPQANKVSPYFNFNDSIQAYLELSNMDQLKASARRIKKNGVKHALVFDRLRHIEWEIESDRQKAEIDLYNSAVVDYNEGIDNLNKFVQYRNNLFTPKRPDSEIKSMLDRIDANIVKAKAKLNEIKDPHPTTSALVSQLSKAIDESAVQLRGQQEWLKIYFSKGKTGRKLMFYK